VTDRRQFVIALAGAASAASLASCAGGSVTDASSGLVTGTRRIPLMAVVNGPDASPLASFPATIDNATSEVVVTVP
jgi:hypothetical protein